MADEGPPPPKRVKLSRTELEAMSKEELLEKWLEREDLMENLVTKTPNSVNEPAEGQEKAKQKELDHTRRENILMMRLTTKEQEVQDYMNQVGELKQAQNASTAQLRSMLLDPAINLMFQRMKKEMDACKEKLEQAQNDLAAWKFTPDSQTGKRLMAKCRMLLQENEELGKVISSGRTAKLEGEIALEKTLVAEMKKSQGEMDEFLIELEEDVEGMQSTIYFLQQQLKEAKEQNAVLQQEKVVLQAAAAATATTAVTATPSPPAERDLKPTDQEEDVGGSEVTEVVPPPAGGVTTGVSRTSKISSPPRSSPSPPPATPPREESPRDMVPTSSTTPSGAPLTADSSNNNTETDLSDEAATEESGPDTSQTYPARGRHQATAPVTTTRHVTKYQEAAPTDNTDATSSEGWSPQASKHSGSPGPHDDDVSSTISEADPSTDAKSAETVPNGVTTSSPQYDSGGEEEDMEV